MKSPKFRDTAGFTLMEMLTVIFVISVLATIAMPAFTRLLPGIRVSSAARQIATDLQFARMRAISHHSAAEGTVTFDTAQTYTIGAGSVTRNLGQLYPGTTITTPTPFSVTFNTVGTSTLGADQPIALSNNGNPKSVIVTPIGRINIP
ncbi:MAG TPA: GspH/FimT family pseudopilin [Verrucomicrobiae bacterium]|jgi:prepilin-type N-terminal cleavage/methylation domain-containing protein|nr:GspH/FimT family pseudopilin [Verrucomicrobiae bacterium]